MTRFKRILLVEDDQKDIELTLTALEEINLNHNIDVVNNGEEALNYLFKRGNYKNRDTENPAVVLLDLKMSKIDGLEVLKKIKESKTLHNTPVVMLTSSKMENDITTSYNLGANAFITKPVQFENFINTIKAVVSFWGVLNETL
jgi:CheY-like chemotaxis protein